MSFAAFCLVHACDAQARWNVLEQAILRRRLCREQEATRARIIALAIEGDL